MKKLSVLVAVLVITLAWTMTAYAGQCPRLMKQIDKKIAMASLSMPDSKKVQKLRNEGARQHQNGEHGKSISTLKKALAILGG